MWCVNTIVSSWEAAYRLQYGAEVDLRTIPSIVGGDQSKRHGIVLARSIPAKEYGIIQLSILEGYNEKEEKLDNAIDNIRFKYGNKSIYRSCFLHSYISPVIGGVIQEEQYPMMSSKF